MTNSVLVNRAGVATATIGAGTLTLGSTLGAVAPNICSYLSLLQSGVADGDQVTYLLLDANGGFEVGRGVYSSGAGTLTRATVLNSSNGGAKINLSGSAQVFLTAAAGDIMQPPPTVVTSSSQIAPALLDYSTTYLASAATTLVLKQASTLIDNWRVKLYAAAGATISPYASDTINGGAAGAPLSIPAGTWADIYSNGTNGWAVDITLTSSPVSPQNTIVNGSVQALVSGNALTISLLTALGLTPTATSPVYAQLREGIFGLARTNVLSITSAMTLTVPNGATLGTATNTPFKLWLGIFDDAGTPRLGIVNCLSGSNILAFSDLSDVSSTAIGTGADTAQVFYSTTAVSNKQFIPIAYLYWETGVLTAGQWDTVPQIVMVNGLTKLPGDLIQRVRTDSPTAAQGTTQTPVGSGAPTSTQGTNFISRAITPKLAANLLRVTGRLIWNSSAGSVTITTTIARTSAPSALAAVPVAAGAALFNSTSIDWAGVAGIGSPATFQLRCGASGASTITVNGTAGPTQIFGDVCNSYLQVEEITT